MIGYIRYIDPACSRIVIDVVIRDRHRVGQHDPDYQFDGYFVPSILEELNTLRCVKTHFDAVGSLITKATKVGRKKL